MRNRIGGWVIGWAVILVVSACGVRDEGTGDKGSPQSEDITSPSSDALNPTDGSQEAQDSQAAADAKDVDTNEADAAADKQDPVLPCEGCADLNGDGVVNILDKVMLRNAMSSGDFLARADLDQDGDNDEADKACLRNAFGQRLTCFACLVNDTCEPGETPANCPEDCQPRCTGCADCNGDGVVNVLDKVMVRNAIGSGEYVERADLDQDGDNDEADQVCLQNAFGQHLDCQPRCTGCADCNGDGVVNVLDKVMLRDAIGSGEYVERADLDQDGDNDEADQMCLQNAFGQHLDCQPRCTGCADCNGDGVVNVLDKVMVRNAIGSGEYVERADLDQDGDNDEADQVCLQNVFGQHLDCFTTDE